MQRYLFYKSFAALRPFRAVAFLLIWAPCCPSYPLAADDTIAAIKVAWAARKEAIRSARIEWVSQCYERQTTLTRQEPAPRIRGENDSVRQEIEASERNLKSKIQPVTPVNGFIEYELRHSFVIDGDKIRLETKGFVSYGDAALVPIERVAVTDGETSQVFNNSRTSVRWPTGEITAGPKSMAFQVIDTVACRWAIRPTDSSLSPDELDAGEFQIVDSAVERSGRDPIVLRRRRGTYEYDYVLDPSSGYSVVRHTARRRQVLRTMLECTYGRNVANDVWMPAEWTLTRFAPDGAPASIRASRVTRCEVNIDVPSESFESPFTSGTVVNDRRKDTEGFDPDFKSTVFVKKPDGTKRFVAWAERNAGYETLLATDQNELVEALPPARSGRSLLFWMNAAALSLLCAAFCIRAVLRRAQARSRKR